MTFPTSSSSDGHQHHDDDDDVDQWWWWWWWCKLWTGTGWWHFLQLLTPPSPFLAHSSPLTWPIHKGQLQQIQTLNSGFIDQLVYLVTALSTSRLITHISALDNPKTFFSPRFIVQPKYLVIFLGGTPLAHPRGLKITKCLFLALFKNPILEVTST